MKSRTLALITLVGGLGTAGLLAGLGALPHAAAQPATSPSPDAPFKVDAIHSSAIFRIKHQGVANFYGRFNNVAGSFLLNAAKPETSSINVTIKAESVDTNNPDRDKHLRSQSFFSAQEFESISFKSTAVKKTGEKTFEVTGELTLRGQTKPITLTVEDTGTGAGRGGKSVAGVEARFTIKRSDYGMTFMLDGLSDEVALMISLEGAK